MGSFRLGSVLGFEIRIDYSWFVIFFLILWSFSAGVFPAQFPGYESSVYFLMGGIGTILFFASLLAHELSHSVVARAKGIPVQGITLFIFGGMAHTRMEATSPDDEFAIAGMGPVSSLAIAALFGAVWWLGGQAGWPEAVTGVARYLAFLNVLLAVFNLLPGFPLDGGRLFRSAVWKFTGDLTKATRWASNGGKWLGYGLMGLGALQTLAGFVIGGLWLLFIGWFLRNAADMSYRQHMLQMVLEGVPAREVMSEEPETVSPDLTLQELVDRYFLKRRYQSFPVVEGGRAVGLITVQQVKDVPREAWTSRRVSEVMKAAEDGLLVDPEEPMTEVLRRMGDSGLRRVLVARDGRVEGIISATDITDWVQRSQELGELRGGEERKRLRQDVESRMS